jgi:hypothetical protein
MLAPTINEETAMQILIGASHTYPFASALALSLALVAAAVTICVLLGMARDMDRKR